MTKWLVLLGLLAQPALADSTGFPVSRPRPVVSLIIDLSGRQAESYVGTVSAKVQVDLGFPMTGTIAERAVDVGDVVASGDVLARLDPEELAASVRAAQAGVVVAEAQANTASDRRDRARELTQRGVGAQTGLDDAERALVAAEARLEQARATLARAQDMLALATLTAPRDGVVTRVYADPGATLSAGKPVLQLSGIGDRELLIDLNEADAATMDTGADFVARLVANPEVTADARLDKIDPVAESATRTRRAHLLLEDPPTAFRLGALAYAAPAETADRSIVLPMSAVLEDAAGPAVWIVDRTSDTVHLAPVGLGAQAGGVVVIEHGLAPGDEVVIRGIHSLEDGQTVGRRSTR